MIVLKSPAEIEQMAEAGQIVSDTLALIGEAVRPGVTTAELDVAADEFIRSQGGMPTFMGYRGYPASTCLSPNAMVVHGIPGDYRLEEGDILSADVGVTLGGFVADSAYTFAVGEISSEAERLLEACAEALDAGIERCRLGSHLSDISNAVQTVAEEAGFTVIRELSGTASDARCTRTLRSELWPAGPRTVARGGDDLRDRADDQRRAPGDLRPRRPLVDLDA